MHKQARGMLSGGSAGRAGASGSCTGKVRAGWWSKHAKGSAANNKQLLGAKGRARGAVGGANGAAAAPSNELVAVRQSAVIFIYRLIRASGSAV